MSPPLHCLHFRAALMPIVISCSYQARPTLFPNECLTCMEINQKDEHMSPFFCIQCMTNRLGSVLGTVAPAWFDAYAADHEKVIKLLLNTHNKRRRNLSGGSQKPTNEWVEVGLGKIQPLHQIDTFVVNCTFDVTADNCHFRPGSPDVCSWNLFNFRPAIEVNWLLPPPRLLHNVWETNKSRVLMQIWPDLHHLYLDIIVE